MRPAATATDGCPHPEGRGEVLFPAADYMTGDDFRIERCRDCGLARTLPVPDAQGLGRYYPPAYHGIGQARRFPALVEAAQDWLYRRRVRDLERRTGIAAGRVMDYGCGRGFLLQAFRERGWSPVGVELSEASARYPREILGLQVHTVSDAQAAWPDGDFDLVTLWHVLEHLPDPEAALQQLAAKLRPGGWMMIGVPDFGSGEAAAAGPAWFHLDVPRHLVHFTRPVLAAMLERQGLQVRDWSAHAPEFDLFSCVQSWQNRLGLPANLLYTTLRNPGSRPPGAARPAWLRLAALALAGPMGAVGLPWVLVLGALGRGSSMTVLAMKPGAGGA